MIQTTTGSLPKVLESLPDPGTQPTDGTAPTAVGGPSGLEHTIGYTFVDPALLRVALTLGSWANEHVDAGWPSNACLEFFGDAVLDLVAADALWRRFPNLDEGQLTRLRASMVAERSLATIAMQIELGEHLYMGRGDIARGGRAHPGSLADALEAVIGAVFLDARRIGAEPFAAALRVFENLFGSTLESMDPEHTIDPKSRLQEWVQAKYRVTPVYVRVGEPALPSAPLWRTQIELRFPDGRIMVLGEGEGRTLRAAERDAAERILASEPELALDRSPGSTAIPEESP